jgi:hypothetical protein
MRYLNKELFMLRLLISHVYVIAFDPATLLAFINFLSQ